MERSFSILLMEKRKHQAPLSFLFILLFFFFKGKLAVVLGILIIYTGFQAWMDPWIQAVCLTCCPFIPNFFVFASFFPSILLEQNSLCSYKLFLQSWKEDNINSSNNNNSLYSVITNTDNFMLGHF